MKIRLALFLSLFTINQLNAQELIVTPNGLKDASNLVNSYVVLNLDGASTELLYKTSLNFIKQEQHGISRILKEIVEGESVTFESSAEGIVNFMDVSGMIKFNCTFITELRFKEGKVRVEIVALDIVEDGYSNYQLLFSGKVTEGYIIFKNNGSIRKRTAKGQIERFFNNNVSQLYSFLAASNDDW